MTPFRALRLESLAAFSVVMLWALCLVAIFDNRDPHAFGSHFGQFFSRPVDVIYVVVSLILLLSFSPTRQESWRVRLVRLAVAAALNFGIVEGIKRLVWLPRPGHHNTVGLHAGFPSGHTVPAFLLAWLLSRVFPRWAPLWFGLATAIAWSRVQVHAHFTYQVVLSAVIGSAIGWLCYHIVPLQSESQSRHREVIS